MEVGKPQRVYKVEPLEDPVPRADPERREQESEEPSEDASEKERAPS